VETSLKYKGYLERQAREVEEFRAGGAMAIPASMDYATLPGLSGEEREVLARAQPATLHAAARISGVRPSAQLALMQAVKRMAWAEAAKGRAEARQRGRAAGVGQ
jgi:tRNA uridine 5-carboxymethylaminomethyl modification enzyme